MAPADGRHIVSSDHILELERVPKSLLVLGGGAVGVEFASIYSRFGAQVTVIEMQKTLLPQEDLELGREFERLYKKRNITVHTETALKSAAVQQGQVRVELSRQNKTFTETAEMLLVAVGRRPITEALHLKELEIVQDAGGYIQIDAMMRTNVPSVYAIGDVVRTPWLAHVASAEALLAIDHLAAKIPKRSITARCRLAPTPIPKWPASASPNRPLKMPVTTSG